MKQNYKTYDNYILAIYNFVYHGSIDGMVLRTVRNGIQLRVWFAANEIQKHLKRT
jgi:hypothetical protein